MRAHPALVLNADFQPLNYFPLSTMDWETAVKNVYEANLSVVAEYDTVVRSPSTTMRLPSVVAMRDFVPIPKRVAFTRFNVFLRDRFRCQYCGQRLPADKLTFITVNQRRFVAAQDWKKVWRPAVLANFGSPNHFTFGLLRMQFDRKRNSPILANRL